MRSMALATREMRQPVFETDANFSMKESRKIFFFQAGYSRSFLKRDLLHIMLVYKSLDFLETVIILEGEFIAHFDSRISISPVGI